LNVWVVIPTYNELTNLELIVEAVLDKLDWTNADGFAANGHGATDAQPAAAIPPQVSILVVDDNSPDGTGELADRISAEREGQVEVLHRAGKMGLGSAYLAGFAFALERGADVVFEMDADFSHDPNYLPRMLALLNRGNDVVVGSRWAPGGRLDEAWEQWRYLLSKYANLYARWITGLDVHDTTAGFKAWRGDALRKLPLHRVRSDGYAFQIEMAMATQRNGLKAAELPIYFVERARGKSKMSPRIILEATWRVWQIRSRW
jgi:dolichol-phosphate mannosyltransferase